MNDWVKVKLNIFQNFKYGKIIFFYKRILSEYNIPTCTYIVLFITENLIEFIF